MNLDLLRRVPLLKDLPPGELDHLARSLEWRTFPDGAILFHEGDPGDRFSFLLRGEIEIIKDLGTADERLLNLLRPGDFLGELSLLFPDGRRTASGRARFSVELAELSLPALEALFDRHPALSLRILRVMSARLRASENATISELRAKNRALAAALRELKAAQARLIEQEKLEHELALARQIQERLLPKELPGIPGWRLAAHWQPARAVSGDFYDFIPLSDGRLALIVADATDKGMPAALVMATACSLLRAAAERLIVPDAVLARANELLCREIPERMFVTCLYVLLDPATGELEIANAGHNLPIVCSPAGTRELKLGGMPLGLLPGSTYETRRAHLPPDATLLLYSDGLTEAHSPAGEMFGLPRLHELLAACPARDTLIPYLLSALAAFTGPGLEQEDDVTFVTLQHVP